jgi:hypothetical protein
MTTRVRNLASGIVLSTFAVLALASGRKRTDKTDGNGNTASATNGGKKVVASCDLISGTGTCEDHHKDGFLLDVSKSGCAELSKFHADKGWNTTTPCPQKDLVGTCVSDTDQDATEYFYAPMHTQKTAEETCKGKINKSTFKSLGTPADPNAPRVSCTATGSDICEQWNTSSPESWEAIGSMCGPLSGQGLQHRRRVREVRASERDGAGLLQEVGHRVRQAPLQGASGRGRRHVDRSRREGHHRREVACEAGRSGEAVHVRPEEVSARIYRRHFTV